MERDHPLLANFIFYSQNWKKKIGTKGIGVIHFLLFLMAEVYIPEDLTSEQKQQNGEYKVPKFTKENGKLTIFHHLLFSLPNNNVQIEHKDRGAPIYFL